MNIGAIGRSLNRQMDGLVQKCQRGGGVEQVICYRYLRRLAPRHGHLDMDFEKLVVRFHGVVWYVSRLWAQSP
jgi:hypothetical protein